MGSIGPTLNALMQLHANRDKLALTALELSLAAENLNALVASQKLGSIADIDFASDAVGRLVGSLNLAERMKIGSLVADFPLTSELRSLTVSPIGTTLLAQIEELKGTDFLAGMRELMEKQELAVVIGRGLGTIEMTGVSACAAFFQRDFGTLTTAIAPLRSDVFEADRLLSKIDADYGFADRIGVSDITRSMLRSQTNRLGRAALSAGRGAEAEPEGFLRAPDFARAMAGRAIVAQARYIHTVSTHRPADERSALSPAQAAVQAEVDELLAEIEDLLPQLNPKLMKTWQGIWHARRNGGPDSVRHVGVSLRHLLIRVLDAAAPPNVVKGQVPVQFLKEDGQPKRIGQVHWICEPLESRNVAKTFRRDLDAAVGTIDAMNEAVHEDDAVDAERNLGATLLRTMVPLIHLLKLWRERR